MLFECYYCVNTVLFFEYNFLQVITYIVLLLYPFSGKLLFATVTFYVLRIARNKTILLPPTTTTIK